MKSLRIAFFGSSLVSAYWNGAATYYRGIIKALFERGHRVRFFEPDAYERQQHRDIDDPTWAEVEVYSGTEESAALACIERATKTADVLVKASGVGVFDELLERELAASRRPNQALVFWDVDAPATLERLAHEAADPFHARVPEYDLVFTYGGGEPVQRAYLGFGARACFPIYNALDPETHFPVAPDPAFAADLSLLANRLPDRERRVEEFFFRPAARCNERRFLLGGSGWHTHPLAANVAHLGHVSTRDHNAFNCSSLAVLNVSRDSMARFGFSPATRVFEAAGAAACLVTDAWPGIEAFLEPGREVLVAEDGDAVSELLSGLTRARAAEIGAAARRRVLAEHTYARRALEVERRLSELGLELEACA